MAGVAGLGTPAQKFAGPPRVVRLKHHVSLSKLLSLTFVFANYPLRTELIRLKTTLSNKKILHKRRTFLLAGVAGFEPTNDDTKNRCLTTWRHPNIYPYLLDRHICKSKKIYWQALFLLK